LKLKYVVPLSSFAFKYNLRRYNEAQCAAVARVRSVLEGHGAEVAVAAWARIEGRMWVARKL
jgi:hypothetical protein